MRSTIYLLKRSLQLLVCSVVLFGSSASQNFDPLRQGSFYSARFPLTLNDSTIVLPHQFIIRGSERVFLDSVRLSPGTAYSLQARSGAITLHKNSLKLTDSASHVLFVTYRAL